MRRSSTYNIIVRIIPPMGKMLLCLLLTLSLGGCLRRPLWIYTDEYRQVELITDWAEATEVPDGMTAWFSKEDCAGQNRRVTTAEVWHTWLNLPNGWWSGVVFDYSPAEYGNQVFVGMTRPDSCFVQVRYLSHQPAATADNEQLYGDIAVPESFHLEKDPVTGFNLVAVDPDPMNADTLHHTHIITGVDGDLILWEDQDTYGATLETQTFYAYPKPVVWKLRTFVQVKGINYLASAKGSVAGLANGNQLSVLRHTPWPCLHSLDTWEMRDRNTSQNQGTMGNTIDTFGFPGVGFDPEPFDSQKRYRLPSEDEAAAAKAVENTKEGHTLQLNLQFLLRDESTLINYHFVTGYDGASTPYNKDTRIYMRELKSEWITVFPDQRVIRIDIPLDEIELPYVDAKDSAGFDAEVSPWEDGETVDVGF